MERMLQIFTPMVKPCNSLQFFFQNCPWPVVAMAIKLTPPVTLTKTLLTLRLWYETLLYINTIGVYQTQIPIQDAFEYLVKLLM